MAIRNLNNTLRDSLLANDSFVYAHLVKFEKPLATDTGKSSRKAKDYVYLTDGSYDILFDDASKGVDGNNNGVQKYVAGKLKAVGSVVETVEARASNMNLQISMAALSASLVGSFDLTGSSITAPSSLTDAGFREGDTILLATASGSNDQAIVRIEQFSTNNTVASVTPISKDNESISTLTSESGVNYTLSFDNPEVGSIFDDRDGVNYARYINRDVFVYKAHIDPITGATIGAPFLLFKGIIGSASATEDPAQKATVSWNITSHWGDFVQVAGRVTSDESHRALNGAGIPDADSTIRPEYAGDLGFSHSEQAINLVSIYQVEETRVKVKYKKGFLGIGAKTKVKEYQVEVDREVDLRFNLDAKYLPVVYGVNKIDSIPVFVDTLFDDPNKVYVAYALCEGTIGGIYDIYFDDTSGICLDANDFDTRSSQTTENTVDVLCQGRMDKGDTLTANNIGTGSFIDVDALSAARGAYNWSMGSYAGSGTGEGGAFSGAGAEAYYINAAIEGTVASFNSGVTPTSKGLTHETGTGFSTPIDTRIIFHAGRPDQQADSLLVSNSGSFKIQSDYYEGKPNDYWGANHRLLDTAYVVAEYTLSEGETTIPSLDFVVRGKGVSSYNYDFSYEQHPSYLDTDADLSDYNIGDSVYLKKTSNNATIGTGTIADLYQLTTMEGDLRNRVRLVSEVALGTTTSFYLDKTAGATVVSPIHLHTYNNIEDSGTIPAKLTETIQTATAATSGTGVDIVTSGLLAIPPQVIISIEDIGVGGELNGGGINFSGYTAAAASTATQTTFSSVGSTAVDSSVLVDQIVTVLNAVQLDTNASIVDDFYNGYTIEVTKLFSDNTVLAATRTITAYDATTKVATLDSPWPGNIIPSSGDTYNLYSGNNGQDSDQRVSTNPALQLLDYLTSKRYGRGLEREDIDLASFTSAARDCDTRSNVWVLTPRGAPAPATAGGTYTYTDSNGKVWFQGTVKGTPSNRNITNEFRSAWYTGSLTNYNAYQTEFENVLGKLGTKWASWKTFEDQELFWHEGNLYKKNAAGTVSAGSISGLTPLSTITLTGPTTLTIDCSIKRCTFDGNPIVKKFNDTMTSGYDLYDSDDVKYWRYLGWEQPNQRWVTRHQTNAVVNTSVPIFDNINNMLGQFNGILRYTNGKYGLAIKGSSIPSTQVTVGSETYQVEAITTEDIVGSINVEDAGTKGTFNQVTVSIDDPQNSFEGRSITMFDSTYLKQDRRVPKKGNIKTPNVTNYFNARLNAKQFLEDSRYSLKINFTMSPRGLLLLAGDIIRLDYSRFGWSDKLFRINSLTFTPNCLVQVSAEEHTDSAYIIQSTAPNIRPVEASTATQAAPASPSGLQASQDGKGGITLDWVNTTSFNAATYSVQIYRSDDNNRNNALLIGTSKGDTYTDQITSIGANTRYYWVRYSVLSLSQRVRGTAQREIFSTYLPTSSTGGVAGIAEGTLDAVSINLTNDNVSIQSTESGVILDETSTTISAVIGSTQLSYDGAAPYGQPSFRVSVDTATNVTAGTSSNTSTTWVSGNITGYTDTALVGAINYNITIVDSLGTEVSFPRVQSFTVTSQGGRGAGRWSVPVSSLPLTSTAAEAAWNAAWDPRPGDPVENDQAWFYTGTQASQTGQIVWLYTGGNPNEWALQTEIIDGDFLIDQSVGNTQLGNNSVNTNTIAADSVVTNSIASNSVITNTIASNSVVTNTIAANSVITNTIASNSVVTNTIAANSVVTNTIAANSVITNTIASNSVITNSIVSNSVIADTIAANSVIADKIAANSIVADKIAANSIVADKIAANSIVTEKLAANAITANQIAANSIVTEKLAANAITANQIAANSIVTEKLAANAITANQIAANSISANEIAANAITADEIAAGSITAEEIAVNAVTANNIAANSIRANEIAAGSITADEIAAGSITADEIAVNAITADEIAANSITSTLIAANSITSTLITANAITADEIAANAITAAEISAGSITADEIAVNAITAVHIAAGSIAAEQIAAGSITADEIAVNAITADEIAANSITAGEITAGAITASELSVGAVQADSIGVNQILAAAIAADSITANALSVNSIVSDSLSANSVIAQKIAAGAITTDKLAAGAVVANRIAANAVNADQIAANSISANEIAANTIDTALLRANSIVAEKVAANSITANQIAANSVSASEIVANSINADLIAANSINANLIAANSITANSIAANSIEANSIAANAITSDSIASNTITADMVSSNSIVATLLTADAVQAADITATNLSSIAADIGDITAGTLKGGNIPEANSSPSAGEAGAFLDLTDGKMVFGNENKFIWFDGTDLNLSGVTIDANSIVNASSPMLVQDSGGTATEADDLNFGTNLSLTVSGTDPVVATINALSDTQIRGLFTAGNGIDINAGQVTVSGLTVDNFAGSTITTDAEAFADNNTTIMTSAATENRYVAKASIITLPDSEKSALTADGEFGFDSSQGLLVHRTQQGVTGATVTVLDGANVVGGTGIDVANLGSGTNGGGTTTENFVFNLDFLELTDMTADLAGTTEFILNNAGVESRKAASEIKLSALNNDSGFTSSNGTVSSVGTSGSVNGITLTGTVTSSGNLTLGGTLGSIALSQLDSSAVQTSTEVGATGQSIVDNDTTVLTTAAMINWVEGQGFDTDAGTVSTVTASAPLSVTSPTTTPAISISSASSTLAGVVTTGAQSFAGNKTFDNNLIISGDLTVNGTTTTVNTAELNVADNIIRLNSDFTGTTPTESAGIEVERGTQPNVLFQYKESGVGETGDFAAGWSVGTSRIESAGFYGTFFGDGSAITGTTAGDLTGLSTSDLTEDPSATTSSGTMYFTDVRAQAAIGAGNGLTKTGGTINVVPASGGGIVAAANSVSVDSTVLRTTGAQSLSGNTTFTGIVALNNSDSLSFESGKHWITHNDGAGDFNIRMGHYSNGSNVEECTEAGFAAHWEFTSSTGLWDFNVSSATMAVGGLIGTNADWRSQLQIGANSVGLSYNGVNSIITTSTGFTSSGRILFPDYPIPNSPTTVDDKVQLIGMGNTAKGGLFQTTGRGGLMVAAADDSLILASGDNGKNYDPNAGGWNPLALGESIHLLTDNSIEFITGLNNTSTYKRMTFDDSGDLTISGQLNAETKSFLIKHPTKEGMTLRHGSLEGPENGVYLRGKLSKEENKVQLPDYWVGLVDEDSITVNLTPIGRGETWVESVSINEVVVGKTTDCFYMVLAERKDVEKLIVEE